MMAKEIRDLYKEYEEASDTENELYKVYECSDRTETYETEWNDAYTKEIAALAALEDALMKLTGGDREQASSLIHSERFRKLMAEKVKD